MAPTAPVWTRVLVKQPNTDVPPVQLLAEYPKWRVEWPTRPSVFVARRQGRSVEMAQIELPRVGDRVRFGQPEWRPYSTEATATARFDRACEERLRDGYVELVYDLRRKRVWSARSLGIDPANFVLPDVVKALAETAKRLRAQAPKDAVTRVLAKESKRPTGRPAKVCIVRRVGDALDVEEATLRTPTELASFLQPERRRFADEAAAKAEMERLCAARLRAGFAEFFYDAQEDRVRCPTDETLWPRPLFTENVDDLLVDTARLEPPQLEPEESTETVLTELVTGRRAGTVCDRLPKALVLKSGRLLVTDPFHPGAKPLGLRLQPGRHSLLITRARADRRSALAATVVVRDGEPTSWQLVDEVAVDVAKVGFGGVEIARALDERGDDLYDQLRIPKGKCVGTLSFGGLGNLVTVDTGGDGTFPIYYGKQGRQVVCVTVLFVDEE